MSKFQTDHLTCEMDIEQRKPVNETEFASMAPRATDRPSNQTIGRLTDRVISQRTDRLMSHDALKNSAMQRDKENGTTVARIRQHEKDGLTCPGSAMSKKAATLISPSIM